MTSATGHRSGLVTILPLKLKRHCTTPRSRALFRPSLPRTMEQEFGGILCAPSRLEFGDKSDLLAHCRTPELLKPIRRSSRRPGFFRATRQRAPPSRHEPNELNEPAFDYGLRTPHDGLRATRQRRPPSRHEPNEPNELNEPAFDYGPRTTDHGLRVAATFHLSLPCAIIPTASPLGICISRFSGIALREGVGGRQLVPPRGSR